MIDLESILCEYAEDRDRPTVSDRRELIVEGLVKPAHGSQRLIFG
jgi:hypothetical protein